MIRRTCNERPNWVEKIASLGLTFNFIPAENCPLTPYWTDNAYYEFTSECIDQIRQASKALHTLSLEAVEQLCRHEELLKLMHLPMEAWPLVKTSFNDQDRESLYLYGRFDLCVDPTMSKPPKMFEYNADTPTILLESSVVQAEWLLDQFFSNDASVVGSRSERSGTPMQYNDIHSMLVSRWKTIAETLQKRGQPKTVHFSCIEDHEEDYKTTEYIASTAAEAGLDPVFLYVEDVGWNESKSCFVDVQARPMENWFKLYPWEFLIEEEFSDMIMEKPPPVTIEPAWKLLLSNKSLLPMLWKLFPGHPNLLPAFFSAEEAYDFNPNGSFAKKPVFGREGCNISLVASDRTTVIEHSSGAYDENESIYQEFCPPPQFDNGSYAVVGGWMIGDEPAGMCVREEETIITKNTSRFVPHVFWKNV